MQVISEANAKAIVAGLNLLNQAAQPQLDWDKAKAHLDLYAKEYADLPNGVGRFGLAITIMPLQARLERGERTQWLYDDIMEVE